MKVKKSNLIFFLYALVMFWPDYFFFGMIKYLENLLAAYSVIYVYNNRKKISGVSRVVLIYFTYFLLDTFLQGRGDIHTLISNAKIALFFIVTDVQFEKEKYDTVNIMWWFVFVFSLMNFCSLILFPNGLYRVETVWNEWGTKTFAPYWIFGYKNSQAFWYLLLEILSLFKWYLRPTKVNKLLTYGCAILAVGAQLLVRSSTATVACIVGATGIWIAVSFERKNVPIKSINSYLIVMINYIINSLLVFGMATFLGPVVQTLFNKDLTFSNRTNAWIAAFSAFLKNPIHGTGILTSDSAKEVLGSLSYMQAHNEWLQCLWQGGIILFIIVAVMFLAVANRINKITDSNLKVVANLFLVSIFVEMAFEAWLGLQLTWIMVLMIYKMKCLESEENLSC